MLRFLPSSSEAELRSAIVECGKICYDRRLLTSNDGNISVRLGNSQVLITPTGVSKGRLVLEDAMVINLSGNIEQSKAGYQPSSETPMHLEVYKQRPNVRAVIHAHPVFATALTVAGLEFPDDILPEGTLLLGEVPISAYVTPSSDEDAEAIHPLIGSHDAILLRQHGTLTVGRDLEEALILLERLEHVAEVFWRAKMLGHVDHIPRESLDNLHAVRRKHLQQ